MRSFLRPFLFTLAVLVGFAGAIALANDQRTLSSSGSRIDHGDWQRLPDAGFRFTVYGVATIVEDGGTEQAANFVVCEPGAFTAAPATCQAQWRAANRL